MEEDASFDTKAEGRRTGNRKIVRVLYLLTAGLVLSFTGWASWAAMNSPTPDGLASSGTGKVALSKSSSLGYLQGATAPDFTFTLFDGTKLTLSNLRGKPVVLNFWASWCPPCREEAPALEKGWEVYKDKGVQFLGVDIQDTEKDARAFMKEFGITYPNGQDTGNGISTSYGITGVPETFFISKEGKITRHWIGPIEEKQLSSFIESLLQ